MLTAKSALTCKLTMFPHAGKKNKIHPKFYFIKRTDVESKFQSFDRETQLVA